MSGMCVKVEREKGGWGRGEGGEGERGKEK